MQLHEKIHLMRKAKELSQEDVAEKLGISPNGYGKIERGETNVKWSRLQKIAEILDMSVKDLITLSDKTFLNLNLGRDQNNIMASEQTSYEVKYEFEKASLLIEQKDKEIILLREQIAQLKEIVELIKQSKPAL